MRGRGWLTVILAAILLAGVAACGGGSTPVFHPAGSLAAAPGDAAVSARAASAPGGFRFPASVWVQFASPLPASGIRRAILAGYQNYVLTLWAAVLSHGKDTAYQRYITGNALTFTQREMSYFASLKTVRGTIRYFDTTVKTVYFRHGADVTSCVDASQFSVVNARSGTVLGPVFPARYAHYLEDVAEGRRADGTWFVAQTASYPASTTQGAMCR